MRDTNNHQNQSAGERKSNTLQPDSLEMKMLQDAAVTAQSFLTGAQSNQAFMGHCVFLLPHKGDLSIDGNQALTCWDSMSNITLITTRVLNNKWNIKPYKYDIIGVGGQKVSCEGICTAPVKLVWGGYTHEITAVVVDFHPYIDLMFGLDFISSHSVRPDFANWRIYIDSCKETCRLDLVQKVHARLKSEPKSFISFCGGLEPAIAVALEMGWRIAHYWSIEMSPMVRQIAKAVFPQIEYIGADLNQAEPADVNGHITSIGVKKVEGIISLPCVWWSRLNCCSN